MNETVAMQNADGRPYTLDGIAGVLRYRTYKAIYPYPHTAEVFEHVPDGSGRKTDAYRAIRVQLGDDFVTDLRWSPRFAAILHDVGALCCAEYTGDPQPDKSLAYCTCPCHLR